jgi:hypothetical protein
MKLLRSLPFLSLPTFCAMFCAMLGGGLSAVACGASSQGSPDADGSSDGPSGSAGAGTGGSPSGDGSIDVSNDTDPAPQPSGYGHLCQGDELREGQCVPSPASDPCPDENAEDGGSTAPVLNSCALAPDGESGAVGTCGAQGKGVYADPCQTARDCGAGLGCVPAASGQNDDDVGGACRDYCCGDVEACPKDTFCATEPMTEASDVLIPVCVPASNCKLLEPCDDPALACTVVRADGTTSCVEPGDGHEGDVCPCADGYMCAKLTNECKKLCHEGGASDDCPEGTVCQGGSMEFPEGFGVCVASGSYN